MFLYILTYICIVTRKVTNYLMILQEITIIIKVFRKKLAENLLDSKKHRTFAPAYRDLAQLVAHTSGGREVAGSSPVIPTESERIVRFARSFCHFD